MSFVYGIYYLLYLHECKSRQRLGDLYDFAASLIWSLLSLLRRAETSQKS